MSEPILFVIALPLAAFLAGAFGIWLAMRIQYRHTFAFGSLIVHYLLGLLLLGALITLYARGIRAWVVPELVPVAFRNTYVVASFLAIIVYSFYIKLSFEGELSFRGDDAPRISVVDAVVSVAIQVIVVFIVTTSLFELFRTSKISW